MDLLFWHLSCFLILTGIENERRIDLMNLGLGPNFFQTVDSFPTDAFYHRRKKVLIVEDERLLCWSIAKNLTDIDCSTVCVENAEEAIRFIEKIQFHLMILDYSLPGMTGLDLLSLLKKRRSMPPTIMITASNNPELEHEAEKLDVIRFFRKPFGSHILKEAVLAHFTAGQGHLSINNTNEPPDLAQGMDDSYHLP